MNTTQLFIEQLLSGVLTLATLVLIFFSLFGLSHPLLSGLLGKEALLVLILTAISYPLGIFSDNIADAILFAWDKEIKRKRIKKSKRTFLTTVNYQLEKSSGQLIQNG